MTAIRFISGLTGAPRGAAETLWHQAALLLHAQGHRVAASVQAWPTRPAPVAALIAAGISMEERAEGLGTLWQEDGFDLSVLQQPDIFAAEPWMSALRERDVPYVTLSHYGAIHEWPPDQVAMPLRASFAAARQNYFVSQANADLVERQTAQTLTHRQVVRAPFNVPFDQIWPWPEGPPDSLKLACIGRLDIEDKGQDVICHVLAQEKWRARDISVSLVGSGPHQELLAKMIAHLALDKVHLVVLDKQFYKDK